MMGKLSRGKDAVRATLRFLGGPVIRLALSMLFLVLSGYLTYSYAYLPVWDDTELPAVAQTRNARIDTKALDTIELAAKERLSHVSHSYSQYRSLFTHASRE